MKTNPPRRRWIGKSCQFSNRIEINFKPAVVFPLKCFQLPSKFFVTSQHLSKFNKSPHDGNVYLNTRSLFKTLESITMPCSVNAYGAARRNPPQLEVTN